MLDSSEQRAVPPSPLPRRRRVWLWAVLVPLAVYGGLLVAMMAMENSLIFFPSVYPDGYWNPPGVAFEDAWFTSADGTRLHGWYAGQEKPRAVVLFAHGNAGNLSHRYDLLPALAKLGVTVLIFDYRGYGRSEGSPSERGILDDARAARKWLAQRAGIKETDVVLMGESLGGGVMVDLAAHDGARGLILEHTFTSLPDVAAYHYPWLPVRLLMRTQLNSVEKIPRFHGPLLQFHGQADTIIPFAIGERLFAAANEPKRFVALAGHDHNDPRPAELFDAIDAFLGELPPLEPNKTSD